MRNLQQEIDGLHQVDALVQKEDLIEFDSKKGILLLAVFKL